MQVLVTEVMNKLMKKNINFAFLDLDGSKIHENNLLVFKNIKKNLKFMKMVPILMLKIIQVETVLSSYK